MNNQELTDQLMTQLARVEQLEHQLRRACNIATDALTWCSERDKFELYKDEITSIISSSINFTFI